MGTACPRPLHQVCRTLCRGPVDRWRDAVLAVIDVWTMIEEPTSLAAQEAEERKKQAEEQAAADARAKAEARDPMLQLRKAAACGPPDTVVKRLGELVPEGGAAVRMRVLYEVGPPDCLCTAWVQQPRTAP